MTRPFLRWTLSARVGGAQQQESQHSSQGARADVHDYAVLPFTIPRGIQMGEWARRTSSWNLTSSPIPEQALYSTLSKSTTTLLTSSWGSSRTDSCNSHVSSAAVSCPSRPRMRADPTIFDVTLMDHLPFLAGRGESVMGLVTPPRVRMLGAATQAMPPRIVEERQHRRCALGGVTLRGSGTYGRMAAS